MSSRNRPRNGVAKEEFTDAHEESTMWLQIKKDIEKLGSIQRRQMQVAQEIQDTELAYSQKGNSKPTVEEVDALQNLYRELLKLSSEEQRMLKEEPTDLIKNLEILTALRKATGDETSQRNAPATTAPPTSSSGKPIRKQKGPKLESDDAAASPGPSPNLFGSATRLKGSSARSGSVASNREGKDTASKMAAEDGESASIKGPGAEKAGKFFVGAEVAYKQSKPRDDGSQWIQCNIISVMEQGNKKRYEVQDPEPDDNGAPGEIYRASASALIPIPTNGTVLPDYPVGKHVLARYPETTTFYRAEVTGMRNGICRLKFEDDQNQEMEVDRRFVLDVSSK